MKKTDVATKQAIAVLLVSMASTLFAIALAHMVSENYLAGIVSFLMLLFSFISFVIGTIGTIASIMIELPDDEDKNVTRNDH